MTTPRGIRNNNPGNIVQSGIAWRGKLANPTDPRFEQFDTPLNGIRALAKLLLSYQDRHGLRTPRGIINRWAPPVENDSLAYAKAFGDALGVGIDETVDLHRPNTLLAATTAIIRHENGQQPYVPTLIAEAVADALEIEAPAGTPPAEAPAAAPPQPTEEKKPMSVLATLLPMVLGMFQPRAQAAIGRVTGADPATAAQFTQDLFAKAGELVGVPVKDDASAVQAVAKLQERKAAGDVQPVQQLEAHALDYLDKLAPLFDRLAETDRWARESQLAGQRAAMERQAAADPATVRVVVKNVNETSSGVLIGLAIGIVVAMICKAAWPTIPDYVTPLLTLAGPLFGQVMKERGAIIAYYFDGTPTSNAAAAINAQIAKVGNPPPEARPATDRSA